MHPVDRPPAIGAAILILVLGSLNYPLTPVLVGAIADHLPITPQQAGLVATADMLGMFAASVAALFWVRRFDWRRASLALSIGLVIAHVLSAFCTSLAPLLAARLVAGFFGGSMMALGNTVLSDTRNPERKTALFNIAQQGVLSAIFLLMPQSVANFGVLGAFGFMAAIVFPAIGLSWLLPAVGRWSAGGKSENALAPAHEVSRKSVALVVAATLPVFLFFLAFGASWTYVERIGIASGLTHEAVAQGLAASTTGGMAGSIVALFLGTRFGRVAPLLVTMIFQLAALGILIFALHGAGSYQASLAIYGFFLNFATPYQIGVALKADRTGRGAVVFLLMLKAGVVVGPLLASVLVQPGSFSGPLIAAAVFFVLSFLLTWAVTRVSSRRSLEAA